MTLNPMPGDLQLAARPIRSAVTCAGSSATPPRTVMGIESSLTRRRRERRRPWVSRAVVRCRSQLRKMTY